jgi:hypothetical protein
MGDRHTEKILYLCRINLPPPPPPPYIYIYIIKLGVSNVLSGDLFCQEGYVRLKILSLAMI